MQAEQFQTSSVLQWSHVFSDMVSGETRGGRGHDDAGFNGAMSFQTW